MTTLSNPTSEGPVIKFSSHLQLVEYLAYWKRVLHLDFWNIKAYILRESEMWVSGRGGEVCVVHNTNQAIIHILDPQDFNDKTTVGRYCAELLLVHELLHCKLNYHEEETGWSYERFALDERDHENVDQIARGFIMAKYGVSHDWFENPNWIGGDFR